jgi:hypothetical protein
MEPSSALNFPAARDECPALRTDKQLSPEISLARRYQSSLQLHNLHKIEGIP